METKQKTALITGANSGLGLETAALLAEQGFGKVILAVRTLEKGEDAKATLIARTGKEVFDILAVDVAEPKSAQAAADKLLNNQNIIDLLILNAGMSTGGGKRAFNTDGVEMTFASHLVGHHILTMRLLGDGLLRSDAHIVIVGSEGARGDMPLMKPVEFRDFANEHFEGDLVKALESIGRYEDPFNAKDMDVYVTTKVYSAWWAAALSRKLPGIAVNAVSPGSVPNTNYARNMGFFMKRFMMPMMKRAPKRFGMAWSLQEGAGRYIEAGEFDADITGHFFASAPGKAVGKMEIQQNEHFLDREYQEAGWKAIVNLAGGIGYPAQVEKAAVSVSAD